MEKTYGTKEGQNGFNKTDITNAHVRCIYYCRSGINAYKEVERSTEYAQGELCEKLHQENNQELLDAKLE